MSNELINAVDIASSIITGKRPMLQVARPVSLTAQNERPEAIELHVVAYYYAALTNLFCQVFLSPTKLEDDNHALRSIMDASYGDFQMLDSWLGAIEPNEIWASPNSHLYLDIREVWSRQVKEWTTISKKSRNSV